MKKSYLVLGIFLISFGSVFSQNKKPSPPAKPVGWSVMFMLTINGHGQSKDVNGYSEYEWTINRVYEGVLVLSSAVPVTDPGWSREERMQAYNTNRKTRFYQDLLVAPGTVTVTIHDKMRSLVKDKGEGDTYENTTVNTQWDIDQSVIATGATALVIDSKLNLYSFDVGFACKASTNGCQQKQTITTTVNRSDHGYGDLPVTETSKKEKSITFYDVQLPSVEGLIKNNLVHSTLDSKLASKNGKYDFDTPSLHPDVPMIASIPESKSKIDILFSYKVKRL